MLRAVPEERRVVTIVFADVAGSTRLGEELDPERVRRPLTRFYEIAREVVQAHEGSVEKFIGDAVMAVFGLTRAHGDDGERALSAALEIRDRVRDDKLLGGSLKLRFGVTTGEVVATRDHSARDFMVTGDAVNTAARLYETAEPGEIVVAERTARSAAEFEFGPAREVVLKGKNAPVAVRVLLGRRLRVVPPTRMPLAGRADELRVLRRAAEQALARREPNVVTMLQAAGTGKTRLVEEFLAWLPRQVPTGLLIVQMQPTGRDATYGPPRQLLRQLIGAGDDQTPDEMLPAALRDAVRSRAESAPLVVVLEDLHFVSESALGVLEEAIRVQPPAALLVVALARPELHERRPDWPSSGLPITRLELEPLSDLAITELIWRKAGIDAPAIVRLIVKRSAGNPFFASELAREALDRGPAEIPDTVQATVLNRLDRLPEPERRLLQLGSIFGQAFSLDGVAGIDPSLADPPGVARRLVVDQLLRRGTRGVLIAGELQREVAYRLLPRRERQVLHAAAAAWLETGRPAGPANLEVVAGHYREAALIALEFEADAPETEELRRLAVDRLLQAAHALAGTAQPERAVLLGQIKELAP
jgi:class 3 adenylate cyclase